MNASAKNPKAPAAGRELLFERIFDAPRALVFKAWIDPKMVAEWWGPRHFTNPLCELDARPGGKILIHMQGPDGAIYPMTGEYREIREPEKIVFFSAVPDGKGGTFFEILTTALFADRGGKTALTLKTQVLKETPEAAPMLAGMQEGWNQSLDKLAGYAAAQAGALVVERTYEATAAAVWEALTDPEAIRKWSFDVSDFKPEPGFEFRFDGGKPGGEVYHHVCVVTEAAPMKHLVYSWRYEGYPGESAVLIELFPEFPKGERTHVRLTHTGLESFGDNPNLAWKNFEAGWNSIVGENLKKFVEEGDAASMAEREIVTTRVFDAPRQLVWEAMTKPEHVVNWWGPRGFSTTIKKMDVRPGGIWVHTMHGPDGVDYPNKSVFKEIVPPERIVYSHGGGRPGDKGVSFLATWTFDDLGEGKTRVTIRGLFPDAAAREHAVKIYGAAEGARQTLERLGEFLAAH